LHGIAYREKPILEVVEPGPFIRLEDQ
jgi:hypothetical protein